MKKFLKKPSTYLAISTVSSIALALHFQANLHGLEQSHSRLNEKYKEVLTQNEDLQESSHVLRSQLEQSQMEITKLNKGTQKLQDQNASLQKEVQALQQKLDQAGWVAFEATYYDAYEDPAQLGRVSSIPEFSMTASGRTAQAGVTIAVDPRIIPLGTWVEVKFPDGRVEKRRADDTGGRIKGCIIDVYVPLVTSNHGRDKVQVRILA